MFIHTRIHRLQCVLSTKSTLTPSLISLQQPWHHCTVQILLICAYYPNKYHASSPFPSWCCAWILSSPRCSSSLFYCWYLKQLILQNGNRNFQHCKNCRTQCIAICDNWNSRRLSDRGMGVETGSCGESPEDACCPHLVHISSMSKIIRHLL